MLRALGLSDERANASIRIGLGRFTTAAEVDFAVDALAAAAARLREGKRCNPLAPRPHNGYCTIDGDDQPVKIRPSDLTGQGV